MRLALLAAAFGLLAAFPAAAQEAMPFDCKGVFGPDTTHDKLVAEFGADNVVHTQIYDNEATFPMASVIYPTDPARRLAIVWQDDEARSRPIYALIGEGSSWAVSGVHPGMSMPEVEAVNGKRFLMGGFNDMDRGQVADWNGGKVKTEFVDCWISVGFRHLILGAPIDLDSPVESEGHYPSDDPIYQALAPRVHVISVHYPVGD